MRRFVGIFAMLVVSAFVAAGCGGASPRGSTSSSADASNGDGGAAVGDAPPPQTLRVGYSQDITTGDPSMTGETGDMNILINVFDPLTMRDDQGKLRPSLATSWRLVNPHTWRFNLRRGVRFQDGEPFDAGAVKFSIDRITGNAKSPIQEVRSIREVKIVNPYTVDIVTRSPDPLIPDKLALFGGMMVPPRYIREKGDAYFANHPVGTGPYSVASWQRGSTMKLRANPDYWGGAPRVHEVDVRIITDPTTRVSALLNGEVDLIDAVPPTAAEQVKSTSGLALDEATGLRIYYVSLAQRDGPLANPDVRRALSYATDTRTLIDKVALGYGQQIAAPLASTNFGADTPLTPYPYDPDRARALLARAGYPNGFSVEFDTQPDVYQTLAQAVSQMWARVGVKADVKVLPETTFDDRYSDGSLPGAWDNGYTMWQGDPTTLIDTFFHSDRPRGKYTSPQLDRAVDALSSETDPATRKQTMAQVLRQLNADAPWVYLYQAKDLYGRKDTFSWQVPGMQLMRFDTVGGGGS
jgi:peptide/nickel transport system substrate-binding protein